MPHPHEWQRERADIFADANSGRRGTFSIIYERAPAIVGHKHETVCLSPAVSEFPAEASVAEKADAPSSADRDLIREGDEPDNVHVIMQGLACRYQTLEDGRRQITAFLLPGDFCDLHTFILKAMDPNIGRQTTFNANVARSV